MNQTHTRPNSQRGAALAIALLMVVIITLLGVAALRATQVELKLAQNAESRMSAIENAESMARYAESTYGTLPVDGNLSFTACVLPAVVRTAEFSCPSSSISTSNSTSQLQLYGYALIRREAPLFVEVNVLREVGHETSAKNYDFARFTIVGGYDRTPQRMSAAEITEGRLVLHTKVVGVSYE